MRRRVVIAVGIILLCLGIGALVQSLRGGNDKPSGGSDNPGGVSVTPSVEVRPTKDPNRPRPDLDIPEQVIYDEGGIIIKTDGAEYDQYGYPALHLICENNSDREFGVAVPLVAINRKMVKSYPYQMEAWMETLPGGRAESYLSLYGMDVSTTKLGQSIEIQLWGSTGENFQDTLFKTTATIKTASYTDTFSYESLENRIYDKDGVTIDYVFRDAEKSIEFLITNQTDDCFSCEFTEFYVNGNRARHLDNRYFQDCVLPGCQRRILFDSETFLDDEIRVSDIETIDFSFLAGPEDQFFSSCRNDPIHIDLR